MSSIWAQRIAQDWLVLSLTRSTTDVGITVFLQFIPSIVFALPGGLVADRYPMRRVLQVTHSGIGMMAVVLAVLTLSHAILVQVPSPTIGSRDPPPISTHSGFMDTII
ncbi:MAG TPA: hypothetical protein VGG83_18110 [Trebonia sp.]